MESVHLRLCSTYQRHSNGIDHFIDNKFELLRLIILFFFSRYLQSCNKDHFKAFINDIIELSTICIRKDCKPQCSGNAQCGTLLAKADIDCIKWAIAKTIKGLKDHDSIKHVQRLEKILIAHEKAKAACKANNKGPM